MSSVDDRIVNMQFNNKQFKQGASESQQALINLEKSLASTANSKGLTNLGNNVDVVKHKFSALQIAGVAAIATIASKATTMGLNFVKSFTLSPLMDGFREYQTNLNSIQTIMANTGAKIGPVNKYLNQLNHYSDQTIYNFSQMANSIGKFTAAGVDMKTSVAAIKGMANTAALSGASVDDLNRAMYQMSQALASGVIRLQDWNSVVNANMGGKNLQNALIATSRQLGTGVDAAIKKEGSFRESLKQGWLTTDVFNKTMDVMAGTIDKATGKTVAFSVAQLKAKGYTEAQAKQLHDLSVRSLEAATQIKTLPQLLDVVKESIGSVWGQVFQGILGNFNQSKKLWTSVGNVVTSAVGRVGTVLVGSNGTGGIIGEWGKGIKGIKASGRALFIDGFKNIFGSLGAVIKQLSGAFRDVFPKGQGVAQTLIDISHAFRDFSRFIKPSEETLSSLRSIFGGVFAVLHIGVTLVKGVIGAFSAMFKAILSNSGGASGGILKMAASVGEVLKAFDKWLTAGGKLSDVMTRVGKTVGLILAPLVAGIGLIIKGFAALVSGQGIGGFMKQFDLAKGKFAGFVSAIAGGLAALTKPFGAVSDLFDKLQKKMDGVTKSFGNVGGAVGSATGAVGGAVSSVAGAVGGLLGGGSKKPVMMDRAQAAASGHLQDFNQALNSGLGQGGKVPIQVASSFDKISSSTEKAKTSVDAVFKSLSGASAQAAQASSDGISKAAESSQSNWDKASQALSNVGGVIKATFSGLGKAIAWVQNMFSTLFGGMDALDWASVLNAVLTGAVLISAKKFLDTFTNFGGILSGASSAFTQLTNTLKTMAASVKYKIIMMIAIAVGILTAALIALTFIDPKKLAVGLGAISVMLAQLTVSIKALGAIDDADGKKLLAIGTTISLLALSMVAMAGAVKILGSMDMQSLGKGLTAIAVVMGIMVASIHSMADLGPVAKGAGGAMVLMAIAMNMLAAAVLMFGNMQLDTLAKGLGAMAVAMSIMTSSLIIFAGEGKGVLAAGAAIVMVAGAMVVLAGAIAILGNLNLETLAKGIGSLAIVMGIMVTSLLLLGEAGPFTILAAASMVMLAKSMVILIPAMIALALIPWDIILKGLAALTLMAVPILAIGAAAIAVSPGLLVLGATIALVGAGMLAAGVGMAAFGAGFAVLAATGTAGIAVIIAAINAFIGLLPAIAIQVAAAFVSFLEAIAAATPRVRKAFDTIFQNILGVVTDNIPAVGQLLQTLISTAIGIIRKSIPQWIEAGITIIDKFLGSVDKHLPGIIRKGTDIVVNLLDGLGKAAGRITKQAGQTILDLLHAIDAAVVQYTGPIRDEGLQIAVHLVDGLTGGLVSYAREHLSAAVKQVADMIPGPIRKFLGIKSPSRVMMQIGMYVAMGLAKGLGDYTPTVVANAVAMVQSMVRATDATLATALRRSTAAQSYADYLKAQASVAQQKANSINKKKNPKARKKADAAATKAQNAADAAQARADAAAQAVQDQQSFNQMSLSEKGDHLNEQAQTAAANAQRLMYKANAEAQAAMKLHGAARKKMLEQSQRDAVAAKNWAAQAQSAHRQAEADYQADIKASADALAEKIAQDEKQRQWQADFDKADAATQASMLQTRAAQETTDAENAKAEAARLIAKARLEAATNHDQAVKDLQAAQDAADKASASADAAKQDQQQADSLLNQTTAAVAGSMAGGVPTPSRSILDDAASAVDRYTASLQLTEAAAMANQPIVQFNQNNYSPEALSEAEIYRQSKNLLAAHEIKMGAN